MSTAWEDLDLPHGFSRDRVEPNHVDARRVGSSLEVRHFRLGFVNRAYASAASIQPCALVRCIVKSPAIMAGEVTSYYGRPLVYGGGFEGCGPQLLSHSLVGYVTIKALVETGEERCNA